MTWHLDRHHRWRKHWLDNRVGLCIAWGIPIGVAILVLLTVKGL